MSNVVAVLLALVGLWCALWGFGVPVRLSFGIAGAVLLVSSVALLVDVEELL